MYSFQYNEKASTAHITKLGGYVVQFDSYCEVTDPILSEEECVEKAKEYMTQLGFQNMEPVWVSNNNSTVYINFAFSENEIVYYPDLIKIKVCSDTGDMVGVEALNFIYNHIERTLTIPTTLDHISIPASLNIESKRFCLIPTDWNTEILCYEVVAGKSDNTYYIYYNAETGDEERVLLVIDDDGQLLI
jgi:germination protein YpeB